jgi:FAD/FMN-containing dehydrogenase
MDRIAEHKTRSGALAARLREAQSSGIPISLRKTTSNLFRNRDRGARHRLDVRAFDRVLGVDPDRMTADVEGMTTYERLVDETLRYGLLPQVVPQLKTITVGGAVSGLGVESSSCKYGLVHETVDEMEILTGQGSIVTCSPTHNQDLFFGFPNSYGTLGYVLRLTIRLMLAKPYVHLMHTRFSNSQGFFAHLARRCSQDPAAFLDGVIFGPKEFYLTQAAFSAGAPHLSSYTYMDIYYRSIQRKQDDWLTAKDYIWRWDTDWFWCSKRFGVQHPLFRFFAKPWLNSRTYQRIMRLSQNLLPASPDIEPVIQDVQIPIEHAPSFWDFLHAEVRITPIWVCPFKTSEHDYPLCGMSPHHLYINFGFWDLIAASKERGHYNKRIEDKVAEYGGKKGLYSTSYYTREAFWTIYDQPRYDALKRIYDPANLFPDLYAKCVERK